MHELAAFWEKRDEEDVAAELTKLFSLQDRAIVPEKRMLLLRELGGSGLPAKAVIAGIKKLTTENLTHIKFATILNAAREFIDEPTSNEIVRCEDCNQRGRIVVVDGERRYYALRCRCPNGNQFKDLKPWNGDHVILSNGRELTVI